MKKLLALVCVIALLGALCVPAMAAAARVPVAADVPDDWTTAYLYAWGGSETMTWPGVPMTKIDDWFVAYMNDDNANLIINNGSGSQTADLAIDPGLPVCVMADRIDNASVEFELPIEVPTEDKMPKPETDKIYAFVPAGWTTVNLYAWTADASGSNAGWPGVPMTQGDNGLWVGELTPGYANIIVNDGGAQTVDLPYNGGNAWVLLTAEGTEGGKFKASVLYEDPGAYEHPDPSKVVITTGPIPTSDVWYVAGTMNGWNNCDSAYEMLPNGDGTFSFTLSLTAGDHALKVTNGTWDVCFGKEGGTDGNYEFGMSADGDAIVTYDGNGVVTVTGDNVTDPTGTPGGSTATGDTWYVAGTMNEWNCADEAYKMTKGADGIFRYTFDVIPGDYSLKVTNGTWDVSYGGDGENGNFDFNAADEGKATVKFDGSAVSVVFGEEEVINNDTTNNDTTGDNTDKDQDKDTDKGGNNGLVISIVATVVILIGGAAAVFFVLKKKD
jgi:hypothetical protein